ncbi:MAG: gamma-butyrobetaine hydroxylase-like domain-containing protein [Halothiobacillus sp.]
MILLTDIIWHKPQNSVTLTFSDATSGTLTAEYLRVFSPSAEVRGHGGGEPMLVLGKEQVKILAIEPVGRYALKFTFDDGHDSGLYDWRTLHTLCQQHGVLWQGYLNRLAQVGFDRNVALKPQNTPIIDVLAASKPAQGTQGAAHD